MTNVQINQVVNEQFPNYIRDNYQKFIEFVQQYYVSQEYKGGTLDVSQNLDDYVRLDNFSSSGFSTVAYLQKDIDFFDDKIYTNTAEGWPTKLGLIKIDDEIISYSGITTFITETATVNVPVSFNDSISFFNFGNGITQDIFEQLDINDVVIVEIEFLEYEGANAYTTINNIGNNFVEVQPYNINFKDISKSVTIVSVSSNRIGISTNTLFVGNQLSISGPTSFVDGNISNLYPEQLGVEITLKGNKISQNVNANVTSFNECFRGFGALDVVGQTAILSNNTASNNIQFVQTESSSHVKNARIYNLSNLFLEQILKGLKHTYAPGFENRELFPGIDQGNFIRQVSDLYKSKGTEASFDLLFQALYGKPILLRHNYDQVIRPSDSVYVTGRYILLESVEPFNNISELFNTTLVQPQQNGYTEHTTAVVAESVVVYIEGKKYFQLFLTNETNPNPNIENDVTNKFVVAPSTKLTTPYEGGNVLTVDSTLGFIQSPNESNNLLMLVRRTDGYVFYATYEYASSTQFFGVKGIENETFDRLDDIQVDLRVYIYNQFNSNQRIEFRIKNLLSGSLDINSEQYNIPKEPIKIESIGYLPKENEFNVFNDYIFNIATSYEAIFNGYDLVNNVLLLDTYTKPFFNIDDQVLIYENSAYVTSGTISSITNNNVYIQLEEIESFSGSSEYKIERKIRFAKSNVWPEVRKYVSDVQNTYKLRTFDSNDDSALIYSNSLPSYEINVSDRSEIFYGTGQLETEYLTLYQTKFLTGDNVKFRSLNSGTIKYYLNQDTKKTTYFLNSDDFYVIEKEDENRVRLYLDRSSIESGNYFVFFDNNTLGEFSLTPSSIFEKPLIGQQFVRYIPIIPSSGIKTSSSLYPTLPGGIGALANGVQLLSNASLDSIFYGKITNLNIVNGGSDYDILKLPNIYVYPSQLEVNNTAVVNVGLTGSLQSISIFSEIVGWTQTPAVFINGGGGSGAKAECVLTGITSQRKIDSITVISGGSGYKNQPIYVKQSNIDVPNSTVNFEGHPFKDGDIVYYSLSEVGNTPIAGLNLNTPYYVLYLNDSQFALSESLNNWYKRVPVIFTGDGSDYNIFNFEPITVTITGITGFGATTVPASDYEVNFRGSITNSFITDPGVGYGSSTILNYQKSPFIKVTTGENASIIIDKIVDGIITEVSINDPGINYTSPPILKVIGKGRNADLKAIVNNGQIVSIQIADGGQGYDIQTTNVQIIPIGGGAKFTANVQSWTVDLFSRYFDNLTLDWGFLRSSLGSNSSTYSNFIIPYELRRQLGEPGITTRGLQTNYPFVHSPLVGFAYDGNPIYGPYGYSNPFDAASEVKFINTSYQLDTNIDNRPTQFLVNSGIGATNAYFNEDWKYSFGYGDLDQFNGRYCVTPEYPEGVYAYFSTYEGFDQTGFITVTLQDGSQIDITTYYSTRFVQPFVSTLSYDGEQQEVFSGLPYLIPEWLVLLNDFSTLSLPYTITNIDIQTEPIYPYVLGNYFKSKPDSRNFLLGLTQDNVKPDNIIRNIYPYQLSFETSNYNYFINKQNFNQSIVVSKVSAGKIINVDTLIGGTDYEVNSPIIFEDTGTSGGGASARVSKIKTLPPNLISYDVRNIDLKFTYDGQIATGISTVPHLIKNNEYVTITDINVSSFSFLQGPTPVTVVENNSSLMFDFEDIATTGIVTTISINDNPMSLGIEYNSILGIGTDNTINTEVEQLLVLNVYPTQNSIRVYRGYNNSPTVGFASVGNLVRVLPNKFSFQTGVSTSLTSQPNKTVYFNPRQATSIGSSVFTIQNHGFSAGEQVIYSPVALGANAIAGDSLSVNLEGSSPVVLTGISTIYVNYLTQNTFNLSVEALPSGSIGTSSILYVSGFGNTSFTQNFTTNYVEVNGTGSVYSGIVSTAIPPANQIVKVDDLITVEVLPAYTQEINLSFGSTSQRLFTGISTFVQSNINFSDNTITLQNHSFQTGDVIEFFAPFNVTTNEGSLVNYSQYFVYVVNENKISLSNSYINSTSIPAVLFTLISSTGIGVGKLSLVNSRLDLIDNSIIKLNLEDPSFRLASYGTEEKQLNIYKDSYFTEVITPFSEDGQQVVTQFRSPGQSGAYVLINSKGLTASTVYYKLDSTPQRQNVYSSYLQPYLNSIVKTNSFYNGTYKVNYVSDDGSIIQYNLQQLPELPFYDADNSDKLDFSVNSKNIVGSIGDIELVSAGSNYKKLPGNTVGVGTGGIIAIESIDIGLVEKIAINDNSYIYSTDPSLVPIGITPTVIQVFNVSNENGYIPGERVLTSTFIGQIIDTNEDIESFGWNNRNKQMIVTVISGNISIGQTITGENSGTNSIVEQYYESSIEFSRGPLTQKVGLWLDNVGFMNDNSQRVHDNDFYQIYAYTIQSEIDYNTWNDPVSNLVHPSGYKKFANVLVSSQTDLEVPNNEEIVVIDITGEISRYDYYDWDIAFDAIRVGLITDCIYVESRIPFYSPITELETTTYFCQLEPNLSNLPVGIRTTGSDLSVPLIGVGASGFLPVYPKPGTGIATVFIQVQQIPAISNGIRMLSAPVQQDNLIVEIDNSDYYRSTKPGDSLQLIINTPDVYPKTQFIRNFREVADLKIAITEVYNGPTPGIDTTGLLPRPLHWIKQKEDQYYKQTFGYITNPITITTFQTKDRPNYKSSPYAGSELIAPISIGATEIFVKQNDPLFVAFGATTRQVDINIIDPIQTVPGIGITPYPEVGITTTITQASILGDYGKIVSIGQTNRILQDLSLGISSFVVFRMSLDNAFTSIGVTEPRLQTGDYFVTDYTNIDTGEAISYGTNISNVVGIGSTFFNCVWQVLEVFPEFDDLEINYNVVCHGSLGPNTSTIIDNQLYLTIELRPLNESYVRVKIESDFITFNLYVEQRSGNVVVCNCPNTSTPGGIPNGYLPVIERDLEQVDVDLRFISGSQYVFGSYGKYSWGKFFDYNETLSQPFSVNYLQGFEAGISSAPVAMTILPV